MLEAELAAGTIEYEDTGGDGPTVVMVHGLAMDNRQWRKVVAELRDEFRCVLPVLPMGAHRKPLRPDADLTLPGMVGLLAEFLEALDVRDVTLCFNDGAARPGDDRRRSHGPRRPAGARLLRGVRQLPAGLAGHAAWLAAKLPGGMQLMRRTLLSLGCAAADGLRADDEARRPGPADARMARAAAGRPDPSGRAQVRRRRDERQALPPRGGQRGARGASRGRSVVWDLEADDADRDGRRLAAVFPDSRLVELPDCYTLIPEDRPSELASAIRDFVADQLTAEWPKPNVELTFRPIGGGAPDSLWQGEASSCPFQARRAPAQRA